MSYSNVTKTCFRVRLRSLRSHDPKLPVQMDFVHHTTCDQQISIIRSTAIQFFHLYMNTPTTEAAPFDEHQKIARRCHRCIASKSSRQMGFGASLVALLCGAHQSAAIQQTGRGFTIANAQGALLAIERAARQNGVGLGDGVRSDKRNEGEERDERDLHGRQLEDVWVDTCDCCRKTVLYPRDLCVYAL